SRIGDRESASQIARLWTPGSPKATVTPISSRVATIRSAPVAGSTNPPESDHVELGTRLAGREALGRERRDVHERVAPQVEIAEDLAHRRALEEPVAGESGGVEEPGQSRRLADHRVVVGAHLVEAGPAALDPRRGHARGAAL